ncbi:MAG: T9SS type A sorting domain-containing protein [Flavobacteriales bacterium]|nr:T9SS type A sorting domain-containing protein [Flavobacteriales bacterium]MBP9081345.1 T9SS type A sorting domain-containing protein [Flavobacteriales bacterium]
MIRSFRQLLPVAVGLLFAHATNAQYTTPNTGLSYTLADLVAISGGVITAPSAMSYLQTADFILAANDTLLINEDLTWAVASSAAINIFGTFISAPPAAAVLTAANASLQYDGIRFEDGSTIDLQRLSITDGGGIKSLTDQLTLSYCTISNHVTNATTGSALELSDGKVYIDHVVFSGNEYAAISSAANGAAAPQITHSTFLQNGFGNTNRPQINLGPSGTDTTLIRNNTVIGNPAYTMVGGIAFSSLMGITGYVVIDSNTVADNRYGITMTGSNITGRIADNTITDNNTQGDPDLGGSGLNFYGGSTNVSVVRGNRITGNLWGVTIQSAATVNLGDTTAANYNPGGNSFSNNGNGGVIYALYNNTPNPVPAMHNCWDSEDPSIDSTAAAAVIFDVADIGTLGQVFFLPMGTCDINTAVDQPARPGSALTVFPNPSNGRVHISSELPIMALAVFNANGQLVQMHRGNAQGQWALGELGTGLYLLKATTATGAEYTQRIVVE